MVAKTRKFGGKVYQNFAFRNLKADATRTADTMRQAGYLVRVVPGVVVGRRRDGSVKKMYALYSRKA